MRFFEGYTGPIVASVALVCVIGVAVIYGMQHDSSDAMLRIQQTACIRIGYSAEAPFSYLDHGEVVGAWPNVAKCVLMRMGIRRLEWVQCEFGELLTQLDQGRFDIVAVGMYITPERQERAAFSLPAAIIREGLLVAKGNPKNLHSYRDCIRHADAVVAVLDSTVEARTLSAMGLPRDRMRFYPDAMSGIMAVKAGKTDALAMTAPTVRYLASTEPDKAVEAASPFSEQGGEVPDVARPAGYAFRHQDAELVAAFNRELAALMGTPEYLAIVRPYGFDESNMPDSAPASRTD